MSTTQTYLALGATSTAYAALLNTRQGKKLADEYTWASVVIGTSLVLVMLQFILPKKHWEKVACAFTVAGIPMIARSLINKKKRAEPTAA